MSIISSLYERLTGRPYITTRSMAEEFGPPPAARYPELADVPDHELMRADLATLVEYIEAVRKTSPATADALEAVAVGVLAGEITGEQLEQVLEVTR